MSARGCSFRKKTWGDTLNIGEKIRQLRISKLMTQADLAGDQITRNMLSRVENGAALTIADALICYYFSIAVCC